MMATTDIYEFRIERALAQFRKKSTTGDTNNHLSWLAATLGALSTRADVSAHRAFDLAIAEAERVGYVERDGVVQARETILSGLGWGVRNADLVLSGRWKRHVGGHRIGTGRGP